MLRSARLRLLHLQSVDSFTFTFIRPTHFYTNRIRLPSNEQHISRTTAYLRMIGIPCHKSMMTTQNVSPHKDQQSVSALPLPIPLSKYPQAQLLCSFGSITDIQCAFEEYGTNYAKTEHRYYKNAIDVTRRAVRAFEEYNRDVDVAVHKHDHDPSTKVLPIQFIIHGGDLIDGINYRLGTSRQVLFEVTDALEGRKLKSEEDIPWDEIDETQHQLVRAQASYDESMQSLSSDSTKRSNLEPESFQWASESVNHGIIDTWRTSWGISETNNSLVHLNLTKFKPSVRPIPVFHMSANHDFYCYPRAFWTRLFRYLPLFQNSFMSTGDQPGLALSTTTKAPLTTSERSTSDSTHEEDSLLCMFPKDLPPVEEDLIAYYAFQPCKGVRIIVLDTYDISYLGWPAHHPHHQTARKIVESRNPNARAGAPDSPVGLVGINRRFVRFNGGVSYEQLKFLHDVLSECDRTNEIAIIWSHVPLHPDACDPVALVWNFEDVLHILRKHPSVQACLSGHDHTGGHAIDDDAGITYITLPGALLTPPGRDCFARIDVYENGMRIVGVDMMNSYEVDWHHAKG